MKHLFLLSCGIIQLVLACQKENVAVESNQKMNCKQAYLEKVVNQDTTFSIGCPVMHTIFYPEPYNYFHPVFHPNNSDEIAYLRQKNEEIPTGCYFELWTFNFCSGKSKLLTKNACGVFDWGKEDWIIFNHGTDRKLWKIKSNGDSLIQVTTGSGKHIKPKWNGQGTQFAFRMLDPKIGSLFVISDSEGNYVDTLSGFLPETWAWKNRLTYSDYVDDHWEIGYYDFEGEMTVTIDKFMNTGTKDSALLNTQYLVTQNGIFWNQKKQLGISDSQQNSRVNILKGSDARTYHFASLASNEKLIIAAKGNYKKINECKVEEIWELVLIDVPTKQEWKIVLPN